MQPQFAKLNAMSETVGKPTPKPTSRIGVKNQKQVGVLYGHEGSGKVYSYLASENARVGDMVTPDVTHPKSGKTYATLGKIVSTRDSMGNPAQDTAAHLSNRGIMMKTIGNADQKSLPGYYPNWGKDANAAKELYNEARLKGSSDSELKSVKAYTSGVRNEARQKHLQYKAMKKTNLMGE